MRFCLCLALVAAPATAAPMIEPARLQAAAEMFAGQAVVVDPRLLLPACRDPAMAWGPGGRSVAINCAAPAWQVFVPLAAGASQVSAGASQVSAGASQVSAGASQVSAGAVPVAAPVPAGAERPRIRRGDRVTVEAAGPGFVIGMAAVADADSRDGRVLLRPDGGSRRMTGIIGDDGRVRLGGLSTLVNGR